MTPLDSSHPSRRQIMEQLSTLLGGAALGPLAGCSSSKQSKEGSSTETVEEESMDPPKIDMAAMSDALGLALAALPIEADADALLSGVQAEIDALHEAGLTETASWAAKSIDGIFSPMVGNIAAVLPANGVVDSDTAIELGEGLIGSLQESLADLATNFDDVKTELAAVMTTDDIPPSPEVEQELAVHELAFRKWMHAADTGEGNLSGQAASLAMIRRLQAARVESTKTQSFAELTEQMTYCMDAWAEVGPPRTRRAQESATRGRQGWRQAVDRPPPPPDMEYVCEAAQAIEFFVSASFAVHGALNAVELAYNAAYSRWLQQILAKIDGFTWGRDPTEDFRQFLAMNLATRTAKEMAAVVTGLFASTAPGWSGDPAEDCIWAKGLLWTLLILLEIGVFLYSFVQTLLAVSQLLSLTPSGLTMVFAFLILQAVIIMYVLCIFCAVQKLMDPFVSVQSQCQDTEAAE